MLTENADCKRRATLVLVKFFQYTGIFSVSRGSSRATNKLYDQTRDRAQEQTCAVMRVCPTEDRTAVVGVASYRSVSRP